jgi:bifunctional non-homologous end joining protein LigD
MNPSFAGIRITHPERVIYPASGLTKLDIIRYYDSVGDWMLPHLRGRPLTLKQCAPDADHCRFMRHSGERAPAQVRIVNIREKTKVGDYMVVDDLPALIALAQRNIIEFHTWNSVVEHVEEPDRIVFDLDPGPAVAWRQMIDAARLMRRALASLRLKTWIKTTGGKGLHIVVPIAPSHDWSVCFAFARSVAAEIVDHDPSRFTSKFAKIGRERQILIDYLRNNRTNTAVAAYSVRARPGATVSVPLAWDELTTRSRPERWTIKTVPHRLKTTRDPWAGYFKTSQQLPGSVRRSAGLQV